MLQTVLAVHYAHRPAKDEQLLRLAWKEGRHNWRDYYTRRVLEAEREAGRTAVRSLFTAARLAPVWTLSIAIRRAVKLAMAALPSRFGFQLRSRLTGRGFPPLGCVDFGDFGTPIPVSADFGWDRGLPIDRYYIERFLAEYANDVGGRVLEVGDNAYSRRFGGNRIEHQDILHVYSGNPKATIVGDVSEPDCLPEAAFDCILFTQTLHLIFDMQKAVRHLHSALKPGGVLLLTVPGISQIDRGHWGSTWFWSLTPAALNRLLADCFPAGSIKVGSRGNVFSTTAFLQGIAVSEVDTRKLDMNDEAYPLVVSARAAREL
jgi:SAM-dependent methyltransferase